MPVNRIGIMQGRLVPPVDDRIQCFPRSNWADEFALAAQAGLDCIEWIYDAYGADVNPIATDAGIDAILELADAHGIRVVSLCADYFMDRPLVRASESEIDERLAVLRWLIDRARRLGIERIVLPFVDASRIETDTDVQRVVASIEGARGWAEDAAIELHLETSLGPSAFAQLLARLPTGLVKVNYDIGNSASLGYDPRAELEAYGDRVGSVHLKDRRLGGGTVPLGEGDADLPTVFACLLARGYSGDIVMQVARGEPGHEVTWAQRNRAVIDALLTPTAETDS